MDVLLAFNSFSTVMQVFKRFPMLHPLQYLFAPFSSLREFLAIEEETRQAVRRRIGLRGKTEHPDFFDHILPPDKPAPDSKRELTHLGSLGMQLTFASWGPMADWFYGTLLFLLDETESYDSLVKEIRGNFRSYDDIVPSALASLPFLHACLEEALRLLPGNNTGLPRYSPGAVIDGHFIPKGV